MANIYSRHNWRSAVDTQIMATLDCKFYAKYLQDLYRDQYLRCQAIILGQTLEQGMDDVTTAADEDNIISYPDESGVTKYLKATDVQNFLNDQEGTVASIPVYTDPHATSNQVLSDGWEVLGAIAQESVDALCWSTYYEQIVQMPADSRLDIDAIVQKVKFEIGNANVSDEVRSTLLSLNNLPIVDAFSVPILNSSDVEEKPFTGMQLANYSGSFLDLTKEVMCQIGTDVTESVKKATEGMSFFKDAVGFIGSALGGALSGLAQILFPNLGCDYEFNTKGDFKSCDLPIYSFSVELPVLDGSTLKGVFVDEDASWFTPIPDELINYPGGTVGAQCKSGPLSVMITSGTEPYFERLARRIKKYGVVEMLSPSGWLYRLGISSPDSTTLLVAAYFTGAYVMCDRLELSISNSPSGTYDPQNKAFGANMFQVTTAPQENGLSNSAVNKDIFGHDKYFLGMVQLPLWGQTATVSTATAAANSWLDLTSLSSSDEGVGHVVQEIQQNLNAAGEDLLKRDITFCVLKAQESVYSSPIYARQDTVTIGSDTIHFSTSTMGSDRSSLDLPPADGHVSTFTVHAQSMAERAGEIKQIIYTAAIAAAAIGITVGAFKLKKKLKVKALSQRTAATQFAQSADPSNANDMSNLYRMNRKAQILEALAGTVAPASAAAGLQSLVANTQAPSQIFQAIYSSVTGGYLDFET